MSIILSSNKNIKPVSTEATYDSYKARVEADGGVIVDESRTQDLFTFLAANGISTNNVIVGANYGVKVEQGVVLKIYSLDGNDFESTMYNKNTFTTPVQGGFLIDEGSFKSIFVDSASARLPAYYKSKYKTVVSDVDEKFTLGYCVNSKDRASVAGWGLLEHDTNYRTNFVFSTSDVYMASIPRAAATPETSNSNIESKLFGTYEPFKGVAVNIDRPTLTTKGYENGIETSFTQTSAKGMLSFLNKEYRVLLMISKASGDFIVQKGKFIESIMVKNGTAAQALAISNRFTGLYI